MKKYVDADALMALPTVYVYNDEDENSEHNNAVLLDDVKKLPAADVVEVVRCKDCAFHIPGYCIRKPPTFTHLSIILDDDFCSYGERKQL